MDSRQRRRVGDDADDGGPGLFGLAAGPIKTLLRLVVGGLARVLCDPCPVRQFSKIERVLLMTKAARLELQVQGEQAAAAWDEPAASGQPSPHASKLAGISIAQIWAVPRQQAIRRTLAS